MKMKKRKILPSIKQETLTKKGPVNESITTREVQPTSYLSSEEELNEARSQWLSKAQRR